VDDRKTKAAGDIELLRILCENPFVTADEVARQLGTPTPPPATDWEGAGADEEKPARRLAPVGG
jgi:hypothetical protein